MANSFGTTLKQAMKEKKLTHAAVARSVGCHRTTITDYANDKYLPSEETFHRIHQLIPDKALYDAFFAAVKPKDRKNKELISEGKAYNYFTAKDEDIKESADQQPTEDQVIDTNKERLIKAVTSIPKEDAEAKKFVDDLSDADKQYIAHALVFIIAYFEDQGLTVLAPDAYLAYQKLFDNYFSNFVKLEAFL